jgi:putative membrane protein
MTAAAAVRTFGSPTGRDPPVIGDTGAVDGPSLLTSWNVEPLQLAPTAALAFLYVRRTRRLARRGQAVAAWRQAAFWLGIALVLLALVSPIDEFGEEEFFFFHMLQHVLLGDLAPLCIVVALTGPVLRPVLSIGVVERLRFLTHPFVALPIWALDLYLWHVPFLYQLALRHPAIHALEHALFFTCGALMWAPVVETLPAPAWFGTGAKMGYIVVVRGFETLLGNVFIWTTGVFYPWYRHDVARWGITAAHDQNLAGIVMMAEGSIVTLAALVWLFLRLAREGEERQRLLEQGLDPRQVARAVRFGRAKDLPGAR